jgi:hypothetical protein
VAGEERNDPDESMQNAVLKCPQQPINDKCLKRRTRRKNFLRTFEDGKENFGCGGGGVCCELREGLLGYLVCLRSVRK